MHEEIARGLREHPARAGVRFNVIVTIVEVGGSISLFHLARTVGASDVVSYLVGSIAPVLGGCAVWIRARRFSGASAAIFSFTLLSAVVALVGSTDPKVLLYKDCATTAAIGLIFLGSCVPTSKPVVFSLAQRYGTDGTGAGMATFGAMWDAYPDFRRGMYVISGLWAVVFLVQAAATGWVIRRTGYGTAYTADQVLPVVAVALGFVGSMAIGRVFTKRGMARAPAADAVPTDDG